MASTQSSSCLTVSTTDITISGLKCRGVLSIYSEIIHVAIINLTIYGMLCFVGCLSMDKLLVYKYTNAGKVERLRIMRKVSPIWRDLGCLMGINPYHLKAIEVDRNGLIKDCCWDIFQIWLEQ